MKDYIFLYTIPVYYGIQLVRQLSIWMTDTFNLKWSWCIFLLYLYVESENKPSIYLSILAEGPKFQYNWTCHQRLPVLRDHIFKANRVVFQDSFYCIHVEFCLYGGDASLLLEVTLEPGQLQSQDCYVWFNEEFPCTVEHVLKRLTFCQTNVSQDRWCVATDSIVFKCSSWKNCGLLTQVVFDGSGLSLKARFI